MSIITRSALVCTILFVAMFCGVQMLPLVQSQHYMELLDSCEEGTSPAHHVELTMMHGSAVSLFLAYDAYAPLTYKVPLAKQSSPQRSGMRMLSSRLDVNPSSTEPSELHALMLDVRAN